MPVPNLFPKIEPSQTRLAVCGEAPGADELVAGEPFVGTSGRLLRAILGQVGLSTNQIFFGNVCQENPKGNDIENFDYDGEEIQTGLTLLKKDLRVFRPNCILLLGRTAFRAARPDLCHASKEGVHVPLSNWRGSLFTSREFDGGKCLGTFHPAYILRSYSDLPFFRFDLQRAARHAVNPHLVVNERTRILRPCLQEVLDFFGAIRAGKYPITFDIEGFADDVGVTMYSVYARALKKVIVIPFWIEGRNYWTAEEEPVIWKETASLLADPYVPKGAHNAFYELFVFAWRHSCIVNNLDQDTMYKLVECFPEFASTDDGEAGQKKQQGGGRGLSTATSILTEIPYYKDQRLSNDSDTKLSYNATDSIATDDVDVEAQRLLVKYPLSLNHYRFNISLIPAFNYIMLRGCKVNLEQVASLAVSVTREIDELNVEIRTAIGDNFYTFPTKDKKVYKNGFNVKSSTQKAWFLYDHLGLTPLKKWGRSAKEDVLLHFHAKTANPLLRLIIRCVRKRTRLSDINKLVPDADGRIRTSYDLFGTPTARLTSRAAIAMRVFEDGKWDNTGTNLQNVTKDLRVCFIPDDDTKTFWQADLAGADGWTVAAELAALGQTRMLEDYNAGIKPAHVLMVMLREYEAKRDVGKINLLVADDLKSLISPIKADLDAHEGDKLPDGRHYDWQYFCCKQVAHASNYDAQPKKISEHVFKKSDGNIVLSEKEAELYQHFYFQRYRIKTRLDWIRKELSRDGTLTSSVGVRRQFFGIRNRFDIDDGIVREAASFNPQVVTTWSTNKALEKLWYDKKNRQSNSSLYVEPLVQIHDALAGQCRKVVLPFFKQRLPVWFDNPVAISGIKVTIPADAKHGPSWKDCKHPI